MQCFRCPSCPAGLTAVDTGDGALALRCSVCRWNSEEAGFVGTLPELETAVKARVEQQEQRLSSLIESYQTFARDELRLLEQVHVSS